MKKKYFLLKLFFLAFHSLFAANPFIKNYTIADGLPSNKIIHVYQDSDDFIWFATDAGVIRFDGSNFKSFSTEEGLSDEIVMRIKEDSQGRLWFMNMNGTLNYYDNNTIYNEKNDSLLNELTANFFFFDFYEDKDSSLYFYNAISDVCVLQHKNQEVNRLNFGLNDRSNLGLFYLNKSPDNKFLLWSATGVYKLNNFTDSAHLHPFPDYLIEKAFRLDDTTTIAFERAEYANIYTGSERIEKHLFQAETQYINSLAQDSEGLIWAATYDKGLYCYDREKLIFHLDIDQTQGVLIDNENNIWVTSSTNGFYKINREILNYQYWNTDEFDDLGIKSLEPTNDGKLWATNGKSLFVIDGNKKIQMKLDINENILSNIYHFKDSTLITSAIGGELHEIKDTYYDEATNSIKFGAHRKLPYKVKKTNINSDESIIYSYINDRLLIINISQNLDCQVIGLRTGRINGVFINKDKNLVVNAERNYLVDSVDFRLDLPLQPFNGKTITSHLNINENYEIYNIIGNHLILRGDQNLYDLTENFVSQIDYRIKGISYQNDILFFFTSKTVYFILNPLQVINNEQLNLNRLNIEFNNINDIIIQNERLYIASDDGLVSIPTADCVNAKTKIPTPYFYNVSVDENDFDFTSDKIIFKSRKRLSINFASLNYSSYPSNFSYTLEGSDDEWITGDNSQVTYVNLSPGNYTFKLRARKSSEEFSEPIELPFVVQPTFFQRTITKIIILLIFLAIAFLIFRSYYKRKIKQKETDTMIISLEHKALQSMMNPHFIFNALGSIQRYLLMNKAEEAGTYLSQFARLIRQNMNSLKSNSITIDDELERLRNYIELEQFRANNKFDFAIEVDKEIDGDDIAIPSMIVQPFVENAIWHGVAALPEKGKIWIRINYIDEKRIEILVEDNGVGFKKSAPYSKSEQNLNVGVSITEKRLQLIGERYFVKSEIITEELNPGEQYPGTRIKMIVPIITQDINK